MSALIVAVDGSEGSRAAVDEAIALARDLDATLTFVCVRKPAFVDPRASVLRSPAELPPAACPPDDRRGDRDGNRGRNHGRRRDPGGRRRRRGRQPGGQSSRGSDRHRVARSWSTRGRAARKRLPGGRATRARARSRREAAAGGAHQSRVKDDRHGRRPPDARGERHCARDRVGRRSRLVHGRAGGGSAADPARHRDRRDDRGVGRRAPEAGAPGRVDRVGGRGVRLQACSCFSRQGRFWASATCTSASFVDRA